MPSGQLSQPLQEKSTSVDPASRFLGAHEGNTEMGKDGKFSKGERDTLLVK